MWRSLFFVLMLILSTTGVKVQVNKEEDNTAIETASVNNAEQPQNPTYHASDKVNIDSYLVPPDVQKSEEVLTDIIGTPSTHLLPPLPGKQIDYYYTPTETSAQSDWYPIAQSHSFIRSEDLLSPSQEPEAIPIYLINSNKSEPFEIVKNSRNGKALERDRIKVHVPSTHLEPPLENAPNNYIIPIPSEELELPSEEVNQQFKVPPPTDYQLPTLKANHKFNPLLTKNVPVNFHLKPVEPTLALHLTPPKPLLSKHKNPTKLYPKKYTGGFKPIPIPIAQFAEDSLLDVPTAKPMKPLKPASSDESEYFTPSDEKKIYLYEQTELKRKLKEQNDAEQQEQPIAGENEEETYDDVPQTEQETSETNYRYPERNVYPAPLRQEPPVAPQRDTQAAPPPGERTEFRMHGLKGPHSYQFGYDTGKGKNRQFRYEERDNDGHVRGHYGYMDKHGKLRVVNYDAHPHLGFHADPPVVKE